MANRISADPRIDPRIKAVFQLPDPAPVGNIASREALLAEANSPAALAAEQGNMPNAAAHRDALWRRMTPAAQNQARQLAIACKRAAYRGCR